MLDRMVKCSDRIVVITNETYVQAREKLRMEEELNIKRYQVATIALRRISTIKDGELRVEGRSSRIAKPIKFEEKC